MLVRDMALFAVAFHTGRRGDDLHHTLGAGVLRLPDHGGFILNFPFGKTLRKGGAQAVPIRPDPTLPAIGPVAALATYFDAAHSCGWNLGRGYLFPQVDHTLPLPTARWDRAMSPQLMTARLRHHMETAGLTNKKYTMHSFRVGSAVSQALQGTSLVDIMRNVFWKSEVVAKRYVGFGAETTRRGNAATSAAVDAECAYDWVDQFAASKQCAEFAAFPPVQKKAART